MKSFKEFKENLQRAPSDCTGIDIGTTDIKVVRLKGSGNEITVIGVGLIKPDSNGHFSIPSNIRARYASIATSCSDAIIKILAFTGSQDSSFEQKLPQKLGIKSEEDYRISYQTITDGHSRSESSVLVAAMPEEYSKTLMNNFASGSPAPYSLEVTSLAILTAFMRSRVTNASHETTGLIDFGTNSTYLSIFHKEKLVLMRKFSFGNNFIMENLKSTLNVTEDIAQGMLEDSVFDLTDELMNLMSSVAGDFIMSRDFIEREKNCSIGTLYATGGIAQSKESLDSLAKAMSIEIKQWDPFDGLNVTPQAIDSEMEQQRWRFAGAIGAALATLEEK